MAKFEQGNTVGRQFQKGQSGNPAGRPPYRSLMKRIPKNAREKAYEVIWTALAMPDAKTAAQYLKDKEAELPECGFMFQVLVRGLMGKDGAWLMDALLSRLFGKPRQEAEIKHTGTATGVQVVVNNPETAAALGAVLQNVKDGVEPQPQAPAAEEE